MRTRSILTLLGLGMALAIARPVSAAAPVSIDQPTTPATLTNAELKLTVAFDRSTATPPTTVDLTFIVTNTGSSVAQNVSLENTLPVAFTYRDPSAGAALAKLGDLASGDTISKTYAIDIPAGTAADRYVDEAIASAVNADSVQSEAPLDVTGGPTGQVLGATDDATLAETGQSPVIVFTAGLILIALGWRRLALRK